MIALEQKQCEKCQQILSSDSFYKKSTNRYDHWCKECRREERRSRYQRVRSPQTVVSEAALAVAPANERPTYKEIPVGFSKHDPHYRLPQYTVDEVNRAVSVFQTLIRWRNEARKKGLIDW